MAEIDSKNVLSIDTSEAQLSIAQLKKMVSEYRKELDNCIVGSDEAADAADRLNKAQTALTAAQKGAIDAIGVLDNSYNGLSAQMRKLKDEQKQVDTSTEEGMALFNEYAQKIYSINDSLKGLDEANGVYSRNVGNYTKSMVDAFGQVGVSIGNINPIMSTVADGMVQAGSQGAKGMSVLKGGLQGVGTALKSLAANPIGAVIMAVVVAVKAAKAIFDKFKESVEGNEVASNNMAKALAPMKAIIDKIKEAFDNFVETVTAGMAFVGNAISGVMKFLGIADDMVETENTIADLEASNAEQHRQILLENAQLELDASEARAKAADKDNLSAQERLKYAQEYGEKQKQIAANNLKEAQSELALLEAQGATGKNNKEMNDKIAEAQAKVLQVQKAYNETLRNTQTEIHSINEEIKKEDTEKQKEAAAKHKAAADAAKKHREEVEKARQAYKDISETIDDFFRTDLQNDIKSVNSKWDDVANKAKENAKTAKISAQQLNSDLKRIEEARQSDLADVNTKYADIVAKANDKFNSLYRTDAQNKMISEAQKIAAERKAYEDAYKIAVEMGDMTEKEAKKRLANFDAYAKAQIEKTQQELDDADLKAEVELVLNPEVDFKEELKKTILEKLENSEISPEVARKALEKLGFSAEEINKYLTDISEKIEFDKLTAGIVTALDEMSSFASEIAGIGDGISSEWSNVFSTLSTGLSSVATDLKNGEKNWKTYGDMAVMAFNVAGNALGALADEQDTQSKEGFEKHKKLQIAQATMSMLAGIVSSMVNSIRDLGVPAGPIVGSILSTMIATMGGVQISKIANTKFGGTTDTSSSAPSVNLSSLEGITNPTTYTEEVNSSDINEGITNQRVYVVESDIQQTGIKVQVAQNESRF